MSTEYPSFDQFRKAVEEWFRATGQATLRPGLNGKIIERLVGDPNDWVRQIMACRPDLTERQVARLENDPNKMVRKIIKDQETKRRESPPSFEP